MTSTNVPVPRRDRDGLRVGIAFAALMLAIPIGARVAAWAGWGVPADFKERALMVLLAAFIVLTGNAIPKRLGALACRDADATRLQGFRRFAGWTWVLTGLAFGCAWLALPADAAGATTGLVVPTGMALVALRWLALHRSRQPSA